MPSFRKGDIVEVTKNPYGNMLPSIKVGMRATVTSDGSAIVGLRFSSKLTAKAWMVKDGHGDETIKLVQRSQSRILTGRVSIIRIK